MRAGVSGIRAGLVFERLRRDRGLAVELHRVDAIVRAVRELGHELIASIFSDLERHADLRADAFRVEKQQIPRPEHVFLNGRLACLDRHVWQRVLHLELASVAHRQPPRAIGDRRLIDGNAVLVPEGDAAEEIRALFECRSNCAVLAYRSIRDARCRVAARLVKGTGSTTCHRYADKRAPTPVPSAMVTPV